jgi:hypothetical protein
MRAQNLDPRQLITRQYGMLDYRCDPPRVADGVIGARLTALVQRPLEALEDVVNPAQWGARCGLFWSRVVRTAPRTFTARLDVPGAERTVRLRWRRRRLPFGIATDFELTDPRRDPPRTVVCRGAISVEKEEGQPWATRITHEKYLRLANAALADQAANALSYWIQAETLSLVSPPPARLRAGA